MFSHFFCICLLLEITSSIFLWGRSFACVCGGCGCCGCEVVCIVGCASSGVSGFFKSRWQATGLSSWRPAGSGATCGAVQKRPASSVPASCLLTTRTTPHRYYTAIWLAGGLPVACQWDLKNLNAPNSEDICDIGAGRLLFKHACARAAFRSPSSSLTPPLFFS